MNNFLARVQVLLKAAPTYLTIAGVVVAVIVDEVGKLLPGGWQDNAAQIGGVIAAIIVAAQQIVRRVTPVIPADRGLLPPDTPMPAQPPA